ncbi:MAG: PKD domain-containing protein [Chloroflexi bacterium]|nr:MAG: PKD domain-containing protein [Chloroflexota bacterium]
MTDEEKYAFVHDPISGLRALPEFLIPSSALPAYLVNNNGEPPSPAGDYPFGRQANPLLECGIDETAIPKVLDPYEGVAQENPHVPPDFTTTFFCLEGQAAMAELDARIGNTNVVLLVSTNQGRTLASYEVTTPTVNEAIRWRNGKVEEPRVRDRFGDGTVPTFSAWTEDIWIGSTKPRLFDIRGPLNRDANHVFLPIYGISRRIIAQSLTGLEVPFVSEITSADEAAMERGLQMTAHSALLITAFSPVELTLTDPQGRRLGYNPATGGRFDEIQFGTYVVDQDIGTKSLLVFAPEPGEHLLTVTGTGAGPYTLMAQFGDTDAVVPLFILDGSTTRGQTDTFTISVPTSSLLVPTPPRVYAGADLTAQVGERVAFTGEIQDTNPNESFEILWDFGDGNTASGTLTPTHTYSAPGTYTVTLTVTDSTGFTVSDALQAGVFVSKLASFVVLGREGVWLRQGSTVVSGDVGANIAGDGPYLSGNAEVTLGQRVRVLDPGSQVMGDSLRLRRGAQVYDVYYNDLSGNGQVLGAHHTPLTLPLVSAFPPVPAFTPGTQDLEVPKNGTLTLDAGDYGTLRARKGATVVFTGGVYNFAEWDVREQVNLYFLAPSEIRIAGRLQVDQKSYLGPHPSATGLDATDILIYVTGQNGRSGRLGATPKAAKFGMRSTVIANIYVPNGTLWLRQKTRATGAFLGRWVVVGRNVEVKWQSGFWAR